MNDDVKKVIAVYASLIASQSCNDIPKHWRNLMDGLLDHLSDYDSPMPHLGKDEMINAVNDFAAHPERYL